MYKALKVIVLGISALFLILPAYGEEAPTKQAATETKQPATEQSKQPATEQSKQPATEQSKAAPREQDKGLDEQVQEIKTDVLSIAAQLDQLEEKLLYPSDTQIAVFVSLAKGEKYRLDAVDIQLDGKPVAHHLYTFKELEALQKGGVQRIYVGNVRTGEHALQVTAMGKSEGGSDFRKDESFKIAKNVGPKLVGIVLNGKTLTLKDW